MVPGGGTREIEGRLKVFCLFTQGLDMFLDMNQDLSQNNSKFL